MTAPQRDGEVHGRTTVFSGGRVGDLAVLPSSSNGDPLIHTLAEALEPTVKAAIDQAMARALDGNGASARLLTLAQAGERLSVSTPHVRRLVAAGRLPAVNIGHAVRVRADDVVRLVNEGCDLPVPEGKKKAARKVESS